MKYELVKTNLTLRTRLNATASCISTIFPRWTAVTTRTWRLQHTVALLNVKTKTIRTSLLRHKKFLNVQTEKSCNSRIKLSVNLCKTRCRRLTRLNRTLTELLKRQIGRLTKLLQYAALIKRTLNLIFLKERKLWTKLTS